MAKPKITCYSDYKDLRVYINGIVHIIFPRGRTRLQSWYEGNKFKLYKIEIESDGMTDEYHYDCVETWKTILQILHDNI